MRKSACLLAVLFLCTMAAAQKNELAITAGGYFPAGIEGIGAGGAVEGNFAHRLFDAKLAAIYGEIPLVIGFRVSEVSALSQGHYSSLFLTPALKLKLVPGFFVSPWFSLGGGWARYKASDANTGTETVSNHAVLEMGGGMDVKVAPYVSLRGELRDFYSGIPALSFFPAAARQHNVLAAGGIVFRF